MKHKIERFEPFWNDWFVEELVGQGSFGTVYKIKKKAYNDYHYSALKHIHIPTKEQIKSAHNILGTTNKDTIKAYFEDVTNSIIDEINFLYKLKGNSNIISYEDYIVKFDEDKCEWDIFIKMEFATSLEDYIKVNKFGPSDVIKLGIDICNGLNLCHKNNIIHRDIKEANIFYTEAGNFKIGDFGVAKKSSETLHAQTKVGTLFYMAPEILKDKTYSANVDVYSLGLMMYKLLNNGKIPFLDADSIKITQKEVETAQYKRINGEKLTKPKNSDDLLSDVILKACEYSPDNRYKNSEEFKIALENLHKEQNCSYENKELTIFQNSEDETKTEKFDDYNSTLHVVNSKKNSEKIGNDTISLTKKEQNIFQKQNRKLIQNVFIICVVCLVFLISYVIFNMDNKTRNNKVSAKNTSSQLSKDSFVAKYNTDEVKTTNSTNKVEVSISTNTETNSNKITTDSIKTSTSNLNDTNKATQNIVQNLTTLNTKSTVSPTPIQKILKVYRYFNTTNGSHIYTNYYNELGGGSSKFTYEGNAFNVFEKKESNTYEFKRYFNNGNGDYMYVTDASDLIQGQTYTFESVLGYVYTTKIGDSVPLYRYFKSSTGYHFYTIYNENPEGYKMEKIAAYVLKP